MAKSKDSLERWKQSVEPTPNAEKAFRQIEKSLRTLASGLFEGHSQKFPPKYVVDISPRAPMHHGKRFASVAAVGGSVYVELIEFSPVHRQETKRVFKGAKWNPSEGYELTRFEPAQLARMIELLTSTAAKFQSVAKKDAPPKLVAQKSIRALPPADQWTGPISWTGPKLAPANDFSRCIPSSAVFTRGEILFTLYKNIGAGMKSTTEKSLPALLELEPGKRGASPKLIAAHAIGFDGKSWSFRLVQKKALSFMPLFVGDDFANQNAAPGELLEKYKLERLEIQSVLALESGKAVRVSLRSNFEIDVEDDEEDMDEE